MTKQMDIKPIVSIVIPVYNAEKYVKKCILSILNQTYSIDNIEIILVNDGSTDNSLEECYKVVKDNKNIIILDKPNSGVSDTRNLGMSKATGKYIMLLDSDDFISEETIANLVNFFEKHENDIDLVTYPIIWYNEINDSFKNHPRYKVYSKGTGIYDFEEYPYINQSTVNIMIKNMGPENVYYNTDMHLSEDQFFNTQILMKKNRIGFVEDAIYYYRRHGAGVSQTRNNPYYCFNDIISYNMALIDEYQNDGCIPRYIQYLIGNTIKWRIGTNELFPNHLTGKEYEEGVIKIKYLLSFISNEVILNLESCDIHRKIYILRLKGVPLNFEIKNGSYIIKTEDDLIIEENSLVECVLNRIKLNEDNSFYFNGYLKSSIPLFEDDIQVNISIKKKGAQTDSIIPELKESIFSNTPSGLKFTKFYNFEFSYPIKENLTVIPRVNIRGMTFPVKLIFTKNSVFSMKQKRFSYYVDKYRFSVQKDKRDRIHIAHFNPIVKTSDLCVNVLKYLYRNPKILYFRHLAKKHENIWLYVDSNGVIDNAYYQFIHDIHKQDGVKRYYLYNGDSDFRNINFSKEHFDKLVVYKSEKHKKLFLQCSKMLISYSSVSIYQPFKKIGRYRDLLHFELVYLQHGILHANLLRMYAKESSSIDKFVVSSHFEINNLINKYNYNADDLIYSKMPRMGIKTEHHEAKGKILFAPSWRKYLIGALINNTRQLFTDQFLKSSYYNEIFNFLCSTELNELLESHNLTFDFKLHPIFKGYREYFVLPGNNRITINFDKVDLDDYNMFITDFSSFQFDYIELERPIAYFLPDPIEFNAGLHTYSELDLKYEDAFGDLCVKSTELLDLVRKYINNGFEVDPKYLDRMKGFFIDCKDPCEKIYNSLSNK